MAKQSISKTAFLKRMAEGRARAAAGRKVGKRAARVARPQSVNAGYKSPFGKKSRVPKWVKEALGKESKTKAIKEATEKLKVAALRDMPVSSRVNNHHKSANSGKAKLLSAAAMAKNPAHVATLKQGKAQALVHQTGAHSFSVSITKPGGNERESFKTVKGAMGWARLRLHEVANPQGVLVKVYPLGALAKIRKNPLDAATRMFEEFHGYPSEEVLEYVEQEHRHSVLAGIGPLISFTVMNIHGDRIVPILAPNPGEAKLDKIVQLTVTEDGRQLELVGGDQAIDVKGLQNGFGMNEHDVRDRMLIGTIMQLEYRTRKTFEADGKEVVDFYHDLGEEHSQGILPVLIYKPRNPSIEIAGGRYFIGKPEGGEIGRGSSLGRVSPGIVG